MNYGELEKQAADKMLKTAFKIGGMVFAAIVVLIALFASVYTVDQGERGVILRNGAVIGKAQPGLNFKVPFIDSVEFINVQTVSRVYSDVMTYSKDQQTATLKLSVTYRLPPDQVDKIYAEFGGEEGLVNRLLDRKVFDEVKNVFGQFNAVTAIQDRQRLVMEMKTAVQKAVVGPITVDALQLENIDFSDVYEQSIEQRMLAEVEVQKVRQNAEREKINAEIKVTQANATADSNLAIAEAEAKAIQVRGEAEAKAINAKGKALRDNPALVQLVSAERWDGKLPATMVPGSAVPFVNVK